MESKNKQSQAIGKDGMLIALSPIVAHLTEKDEGKPQEHRQYKDCYVLDQNLAIVDPVDGYLEGGYSYPLNWRDHPRVRPDGNGRAKIALGNVKQLEGKSLMLGALHHYGHFYTDTLCRSRQHTEKHDWYISNTTPKTEWLELISHCTGIDEKELRLRLVIPPENGCLKVEELSYSSIRCSKTRFDDETISVLRGYRDRVGEHVASRESKSFIITRKKAARRRLLLEPEAIQTLAATGTKEITPDEMTLKEQIRLFGSAEHIILPAGSECYNLCYCKPGTRVYIAISEEYLLRGGHFGQHIQSLCQKASLELTFILCDEIGGNRRIAGHNNHIFARTRQLLRCL